MAAAVEEEEAEEEERSNAGGAVAERPGSFVDAAAILLVRCKARVRDFWRGERRAEMGRNKARMCDRL